MRHRIDLGDRSGATSIALFCIELVVCAARVQGSPPMRTRYDQFGKQMVRTAVIARGPVETDAEVPADTRRIDLWFNPAPDSAPRPFALETVAPHIREEQPLESTPAKEETAGAARPDAGSQQPTPAASYPANINVEALTLNMARMMEEGGRALAASSLHGLPSPECQCVEPTRS